MTLVKYIAQERTCSYRWHRLIILLFPLKLYIAFGFCSDSPLWHFSYFPWRVSILFLVRHPSQPSGNSTRSTNSTLALISISHNNPSIRRFFSKQHLLLRHIHTSVNLCLCMKKCQHTQKLAPTSVANFSLRWRRIAFIFILHLT